MWLNLFQTLYQGSVHAMELQQLVLDVEGTRVFLSPKEPGKRNQLWRMTSSGMIQVSTQKSFFLLNVGAPKEDIFLTPSMVYIKRPQVITLFT